MSSENVDTVSNAAPVAPSIIIQQPQNMTSNSPATIYWHSTAPENDPAFVSILMNDETFHNSYGLARSVPTSAGIFTKKLPSVIPGPHFVVQLVSFDKNCDAHVYATSPPFAVAPDPSCPHPQAPVIIRIG